MCVVKMRGLCDLHPWGEFRRKALFKIITRLHVCSNTHITVDK